MLWRPGAIDFGGIRYARKIEGKQDQVPVQAILEGEELTGEKAGYKYRHIYSWSAFRPWIDTTFQGFNLTRYVGYN